ncbi:MAG: hypothetical protein ACRCT8_01915 [Lacipirellulaceae bacterium]
MNPLRILAAAVLVSAALAPVATACPFCTAETRTLTEEMTDSSVVLLGKLTAPAPSTGVTADDGVPYGFVDPETGAATFSVERVLKGDDLMLGVESVDAVYFGADDRETTFFLRGVGAPPDWSIPLPLSATATAYIGKLPSLPPAGVERLAFFQDYLEHADPLLAQDAYDEFARAPYQDVIDLRDRMDRDQLLAWIESPSTSPSRRRLFLTMLGVCGEPEDLKPIEAMLTSDGRKLGPPVQAGVAASLAGGGPIGGAIVSELALLGERQRKLGLDAMIACYLTLAAKHGDVDQALDLVDERFLKDAEADYSHVYAALMALRFLGEEQTHTVPMARIVESARMLLANADFADQVIPDLARWEDWGVMERLEKMYLDSVENDSNKYTREPIITYLDVASEVEGEVGQRAKQALATIEPLDADAVKRARSLRAFGFLAQARPKAESAGATRPDAPKLTSEAYDKGDAPLAKDEPPADPASLAALGPDGKPVAKAAGPDVAAPDAPEASSVVATSLSAPRPAGPVPSTGLLIGAPLLAAAVCGGLFWLILRGGSA